MQKFKAICSNQVATVEASGAYQARLKAAPIFQTCLGRKVEGIEITVLELGPDGKPLSKLQRFAHHGATIYVVQGQVTDPDAYDGKAKVGDVEYRFTADHPTGAIDYSEDYLDLAEGMKQYRGAKIEWWDGGTEVDPEAAQDTPGEVEISGETLEAVTKVSLSFVVTHSLHTEVTTQNLAELVREHVNLRSDADLADMIDSHEMLELVAEDGSDRKVLYRAKSAA